MATPDRLATMAMMMLQTLCDATGGRLEWRNIDLVVSQAEHFEALEYAVGQQWIEVSALFDAVRLTAEGRRVLIGNAGRLALQPRAQDGRSSR